MEKEIKINEDKCYVDKRKLILDCVIAGKNYVFTLNEWDWNKDRVESLTIDGEAGSYGVITSYKHCIQAWFDADEDRKVFIDRRYEHNHEYDVYYGGKSYQVNCPK